MATSYWKEWPVGTKIEQHCSSVSAVERTERESRLQRERGRNYKSEEKERKTTEGGGGGGKKEARSLRFGINLKRKERKERK